MPMPVSLTRKRRVTVPAPPLITEIQSVTLPVSVNFTELLARLISTCERRMASPVTTSGRRSSVSTRKSSPLWAAASRIRSQTLSIIWRKEKGCLSSVSLPASTLEMSRMSDSTISR